MKRKLANLVFLLGLLPWFMVFMFSAMLFDAPGSQSSVLLWCLFYSIASYPLLVIIGFVGSRGFRRLKPGEHRRAWFALLPILSPIAFVCLFTIIGVFCNGELACHLS